MPLPSSTWMRKQRSAWRNRPKRLSTIFGSLAGMDTMVFTATYADIPGNLPLPEAFDYAEPEAMGLAVGDIVAAPLGPRLVRGVVTGLRDATGVNRALKAVAGRIETPPLPPESLAFVEWAARYAVDQPGQRDEHVIQ